MHNAVAADGLDQQANMNCDDDLSIGGDGPCPVCRETIPALTWRRTENARLSCCGNLVCRKCITPATTGVVVDDDAKVQREKVVVAPCDVGECPVCGETASGSASDGEDGGNPTLRRLRVHADAGRAWAQHEYAMALLGICGGGGGGGGGDDGRAGGTVDGRGDAAEALRLVTEAAERGYGPSRFALGRIYHEGDVPGVDRSLSTARRWYELAAYENGGDAMAQLQLGALHDDAGRHAEAARCWEMAAERGHDEAQTFLAVKCQEGSGVPTSRRRAEYWFRRAADQGNDMAQMFLGLLLCENGDVDGALGYWEASAKQGNEEAKEMLEHFGGVKDDDADGAEYEDVDNLPDGLAVTSYFRNDLERRAEEEEGHEEEVTFIRPDGDTEIKDVGWCKSQGYEEIADGVWSGPWGWGNGDADSTIEIGRRGRDESDRKGKDRKGKRGKVTTIDRDAFDEILALKQRANAAFARGKYAVAVRIYDEALERFPPYAEIMPAEQIGEHVKILSNRSECLLRTGRYAEAGAAAHEALQLDASHEKSLFRRAKAAFLEADTGDVSAINPFVIGQAKEDLANIVSSNGTGAADAQSLLDEIRGVAARDVGQA